MHTSSKPCKLFLAALLTVPVMVYWIFESFTLFELMIRYQEGMKNAVDFEGAVQNLYTGFT